MSPNDKYIELPSRQDSRNGEFVLEARDVSSRRAQRPDVRPRSSASEDSQNVDTTRCDRNCKKKIKVRPGSKHAAYSKSDCSFEAKDGDVNHLNKRRLRLDGRSQLVHYADDGNTATGNGVLESQNKVPVRLPSLPPVKSISGACYQNVPRQRSDDFRTKNSQLGWATDASLAPQLPTSPVEKPSALQQVRMKLNRQHYIKLYQSSSSELRLPELGSHKDTLNEAKAVKFPEISCPRSIMKDSKNRWGPNVPEQDNLHPDALVNIVTQTSCSRSNDSLGSNKVAFIPTPPTQPYNQAKPRRRILESSAAQERADVSTMKSRKLSAPYMESYIPASARNGQLSTHLTMEPVTSALSAKVSELERSAALRPQLIEACSDELRSCAGLLEDAGVLADNSDGYSDCSFEDYISESSSNQSIGKTNSASNSVQELDHSSESTPVFNFRGMQPENLLEEGICEEFAKLAEQARLTRQAKAKRLGLANANRSQSSKRIGKRSELEQELMLSRIEKRGGGMTFVDSCYENDNLSGDSSMGLETQHQRHASSEDVELIYSAELEQLQSQAIVEHAEIMKLYTFQRMRAKELRINDKRVPKQFGYFEVMPTIDE